MSNLSFKIQAPPKAGPSASRALPRSRSGWDNDDEEEDRRVEKVREFDAKGSKRKQREPELIVIPSLPNRDWMNEASSTKRKQSNNRFLPPGAAAASTGRDAETTASDVDAINTNTVRGGLEQLSSSSRPRRQSTPPTTLPPPQEQEQNQETEEQRALKELLKGSSSETTAAQDLVLPQQADEIRLNSNKSQEVKETDAFRRDVESRPDQAPLEAYERIPVDMFGAAMLRGMGWKQGQSVSKSGRKGPTEAYVTPARPALLGIGAKPIDQALFDPNAPKAATATAATKKPQRPEYKFTPLVKIERSRPASPASTASSAANLSDRGEISSASEGQSSTTRRRSRSRSPHRHRHRDHHSSSRHRSSRDDDDDRHSSRSYRDDRGDRHRNRHRDDYRERRDYREERK